jgi:hypothetical protein
MTRQHCQMTGRWPRLPTDGPVSPPSHVSPPFRGDHVTTPANASTSSLGVLASLRDQHILTQRRKVAKRITKATPWQFSFFQRGGQASSDEVLCTSDCLKTTPMTRQHCQMTGRWPRLPTDGPISPPSNVSPPFRGDYATTPANASTRSLGVLASLRDQHILTQRRKDAKRNTKATPWRFSFFQRRGQASSDQVLCTSDCLNNTPMTRQHCQMTGGWPHFPPVSRVSGICCPRPCSNRCINWARTFFARALDPASRSG